jgi:hypothetical protein
MDSQVIRERAVAFMLDRGWKEKTAKRKLFEQTLFDHTVVELDALLVLMPLLRPTFSPPLTEQEEEILVASVIAHDVGKELLEWQEYVLGRRAFLSDVNQKLAEEVVPQLASRLGFKGVDEMLSGVLLHMKYERTPAKVMDRVLFGKHTNERWKTLADLVDAVDNLCSAKGLFAGLQYLEERSGFGSHIRTSYHLVQLRGVSTTLVHRAAIDTFAASGWSPLLHYSNGSIYVASATAQIAEPTTDAIKTRLAENVKAALPENMSKLLVGSPLETMIPKVDLFDYRDLRTCLRVAARRVNRARFRKKPDSARREVIGKYLLLLENLKRDIKSAATKSEKDWKEKRRPDIDSHILAGQTERIGIAHPEMCIFKLFKAALAPELVGDKITPEAKKAYADVPESAGKKKTAQITPESVARAEYDNVFGAGAFALLQATSTLMPARDMALTVDRFWSLSGTRFGLAVARIENLLDDAKREEILIDTLVKIGNKVYSALPEANRPTRATPEQIATCFVTDLVHPTPPMNLTELVFQQMRGYAQTKMNARRNQGAHLCPICNTAFEGGAEAKADFVDNPDAHTNRAASHDGGGKIVICDACKYERFLQQLLLGSKVSEVLVLFPRMNIGHGGGEALRQRVANIWDIALNRMSEKSSDPYQHVSLDMTFNVARNLEGLDVFRLTARDIVDLMTYESSEEAKKKNRKELEERLRELYGMSELSVNVLNENWGTSYATKDKALQALIENNVNDDEARKVRAVAFRLTPQLRVVCQTPHMILVPVTNPIQMKVRGAGGKMEDEADVNSAIRELYITLILGLALDCSVAVMNPGEVITFEGGEGVARVPPVPAVRNLIGGEWVPIETAKRWLDAIGAAALLANNTAFPGRSNLYAVLKSPTAGHILRRIEQKSKSGQAYMAHIHLLETVKEVLR